MDDHTIDVAQHESGSSAGTAPEGPVARAIETRTARIPSDWFLWTAGGAVLASLACHAAGRKQTGNFIAAWVPTILIAGLYNKLVKVHGHDAGSGEFHDTGDSQPTEKEIDKAVAMTFPASDPLAMHSSGDIGPLRR